MICKTAALLTIHIAFISSLDQKHSTHQNQSAYDKVGYNDVITSYAPSDGDCTQAVREGRPQVMSVSFEMTATFRSANRTVQLTPLFSNHLSALGGMFLGSAVTTRKLSVIKDLLNMGSNPDIRDKYGVTPLYRALEINFSEAALVLLKCGADVNIEHEGDSLLHTAVQRGSLNIVEKLVRIGATIDVVNSEGYTPLFLAITANKSDIAKFLLSRQANVNFKSLYGRSLLHMAVLENSFDAMCQIIRLGADIDTEDIHEHTPLFTAINLNNTEIIDILLEKGANVDFVSSKGNPILHTAVSETLMHVVLKLIDLDVEISTWDKRGLTPLHRAIETDDVEMLLVFLKFYDDLNRPLPSSGDSPMHFAIRKGAISCTILLLELGNPSALNENGLTPFALAVYLNQTAITKLFLDNYSFELFHMALSYDIIKYNEWYSPLHFAVLKNNLGAAENLINYGAHVNRKDHEGKTPLWRAVERNSSEMVDLLLSNGAVASVKPHQTGDSMIHVAVSNQCMKCAKSLIESGADVNAQGDACLTPLLIAAISGNDELMKFLVSKGANVNFETTCTLESIITSQDNRALDKLKSVFDLLEKNETIGLTQRAVEINKPEVLRYLIGNSSHFDPKRRDKLLRLAVKRGNLEAMKVLIKFGMAADETKGYESLLSLALENRQPQAMEALIKYGADLDLLVKLSVTIPGGVIRKPWSLLHQASYINGVDEATVLLDNGMDVNIKDGVLWTPLHVAALSSSVEVAQLLIRRGADLTARSAHGYTPLYIAQSTHSNKMISLLKCHSSV